MANPTASFIIATRKRPCLLQHCLEHLLAQPYSHKEIIVVDSSTNDQSEQVVAQYPEVINVLLRGQRNNMPQARSCTPPVLSSTKRKYPSKLLHTTRGIIKIPSFC